MLGHTLRGARLDGSGPPYVEKIGANGSMGRYYKTNHVMAWRRGGNLVRVAKRVRHTYESMSDLQRLRKQLADMEIYNGQIENERRELQRKLKRYATEPDELGLLSEGRILTLGRQHSQRCGVYFLINDNRIVYVGRSVNIEARVGSHHATKVFTHYAFVECPESHMNALEGLYIEKFDPPLNGRSNGNYDMRSYEYRNLLSQRQGA
jgi:hypothetical protein